MANIADYTDYSTSIAKRLMTESQKAREAGMSALSSRGMLRSGAMKSLEERIQESFMQRLSEILPQEVMRGQQFQEQVRQFNEQMSTSQASQTLAASQREQQMGEGRRQFDINTQLQRDQLAQQENMIQAQLAGQKEQQKNWWQPILGTALGAFTGGVAGGLGAGLASKWAPTAWDTYLKGIMGQGGQPTGTPNIANRQLLQNSGSMFNYGGGSNFMDNGWYPNQISAGVGQNWMNYRPQQNQFANVMPAYSALTSNYQQQPYDNTNLWYNQDQPGRIDWMNVYGNQR